jgi:hypothetical protein
MGLGAATRALIPNLLMPLTTTGHHFIPKA